MPTILKIGEVIDIGIEKEKARRDFYGRVADAFPEQEIRSLFVRLRDWEEGHVRLFQSLRDSVPEPQPAESYSGELTAYMQALVDERLYRNVEPDDFARNIHRPMDAILYGITFEKDAILFFEELLPYLQSDPQNLLRRLIDEERSHIRHLTELKEKFRI